MLKDSQFIKGTEFQDPSRGKLTVQSDITGPNDRKNDPKSKLSIPTKFSTQSTTIDASAQINTRQDPAPLKTRRLPDSLPIRSHTTINKVTSGSVVPEAVTGGHRESVAPKKVIARSYSRSIAGGASSRNVASEKDTTNIQKPASSSHQQNTQTRRSVSGPNILKITDHPENNLSARASSGVITTSKCACK